MDKIKKDALLSVRHLTVEYTSEGEVIHAVNDVSFELEKGKTIGLVGGNGRRQNIDCKGYSADSARAACASEKR